MLALKATVPLGVPVLPQTSMVLAVKEAVSKRNALIHTGAFDLSIEQLDAVLDTSEDFVWLMDFYRGYLWALGKMRPEALNGIAHSGGFATRTALVNAVLSAKPV